MKKLILVVSPPACGKTYVSKKLAQALPDVYKRQRLHFGRIHPRTPRFSERRVARRISKRPAPEAHSEAGLLLFLYSACISVVNASCGIRLMN